MDYKEKVIALLKSQELSKEQKEKLEGIFPELKESEDEKMRKWIINYLNNKALNSSIMQEKTNIKNAIAWLEKQGEQKPVFEMKTPEESLGIDSETYSKIVDECIYGEKAEPKFHEGDWTVSNLDGKARQISEVHFDEYNSYYMVNGQSVNLEEYDRLHHLWTIQDAKDGDVLYECNEKKPFIFKELETKHIGDIASYCDIFNGIFNSNEDSWTTLDIVPATKEQRDTLLKAMTDAGYTFDFDKKELKKIEQKSAWSEEDEQYLLVCKNALAKYQVSDKWDAHIISHWLEDKLKSLRPQNTWKPSDEQMSLLEELVEDNNQRYFYTILRSLYEQLKKLKEV